MRPDKHKALKLRLNGKSYTEIKNILGVPKSTLSDWFSELPLSPAAQTKIQKRFHAGSLKGLLKRNRNQTHLAIQRARTTNKNASQKIPHLAETDILILGAALYWAEGYKRTIVKNGRERTYHPVGFSNADPDMIKIFLRFLREICKVPDQKIKIQVRIFEHLNVEATINFWQTVTRLPRKNFEKSYYGISKSSQHKKPYNRLPYGSIQIRICDTQLFHTIMGWIHGLIQQT